MWAVWILITVIVAIINVSQLLSIAYAYLVYKNVYKELPKKQKKTYKISFFLHFAVILTWIILCATIDAINKYWYINLIVWLLCFVITIGVIIKKKEDIFLSMIKKSHEYETETESNITKSINKNNVENKKMQPITISYSELVNMITNLMDAKKNLPNSIFCKIKEIYDDWRLQVEKREVDESGWFEMCKNIIKSYEQVAPYPLFDGKVSKELTNQDINDFWEMHRNGVRFDDLESNF